jgi:hypothetical protein
MPSCSSCGTDVPATGRFCSACGAPASEYRRRGHPRLRHRDFAAAAAATVEVVVNPRRDPPVPPNTRVKAAFSLAACWPARYRIIALLGRGGMGEVYRADDLTLWASPWPSSFLPDEAARDQGLLERFQK